MDWYNVIIGLPIILIGIAIIVSIKTKRDKGEKSVFDFKLIVSGIALILYGLYFIFSK